MTALRKFNCVLLLVALQLLVASGFQVARPKTSYNGLPQSDSLSNTPLLPRNAGSSSRSFTSTGTLMAATPQEEQAVAEFKMITEEESQLRKTGGIVIGVITVVSFFAQGQDYANLCTGAFFALSTYRTGAEYQWGCIVNNSWNMGSPFSMEKVPEEFQGFIKEKQLQLVNNVATSAVFGVVLANVVSLIAGDASTQVLLETSKTVLPIFALVTVATGLTTLVNKE